MFETIKEVVKDKVKHFYERRKNREVSQPQVSLLQRFDKLQGKWYFRKIKIDDRSGYKITTVKRVPLKIWAFEMLLFMGIIVALIFLLVSVKSKLPGILG